MALNGIVKSPIENRFQFGIGNCALCKCSISNAMWSGECIEFAADNIQFLIAKKYLFAIIIRCFTNLISWFWFSICDYSNISI